MYALSTIFNTNKNDLDKLGRIDLHLTIDDEGNPTNPTKTNVRISIRSEKGMLPPWTVISRIKLAMIKHGWHMEGMHLTGFHFSTKETINKSPWYDRMSAATRRVIQGGPNNLLIAHFWDGRYWLLITITRPDREG